MNQTVGLSDTELLMVKDETGCQTYCGSDQDWFTTERQRLTGCGPSAAANALYYLKRKASSECCTANKDNLLAVMNETWRYVTPGDNGIPSTALFQQKLEEYAAAHDEQFQFHVLDVPQEPKQRPSMNCLVKYLADGLRQDIPIAFLNLCNGAVENLERWHWVTIVALEYSEDTRTAYASICDEGVGKRIDLALWIESTTRGGGFLYFQPNKIQH